MIPAVERPGAARLDRSLPTPLWAQLHADLLRRVEGGEFTRSFPGELALAAAYEVSRNTVREALRRLRADGTVVAGRGHPPRLGRQTEITQPLGALYSLFASVRANGLSATSSVRVLDVRADGVVAAKLGLEESTPLLYLERVRFAGGTPLAVDRVWLPHALAAGLRDADFTETSLYRELDERCGIRLTDGQERIRAVVPTPGERRLLAAPADTAALAIDRLGLAGRTPVEWRHTVVRGDRFSVLASFTAKGYQLDVHSGPKGPGWSH
ncbi:GntR family transcriptional regulator [Actinokineospora globicatena]|uniref:GntR-family transcriptional regulator n=1 Tax=Actinokineospora globicatena TaxID=103729 RepID=A0A9W6V9K3_9PSEU|nr:GntR family transcriptional regulator [Actinokineospora globicatena]GLW95240.1 putative GntR-family transcriptional regulator [Actinokineospora globicatena]